MNDDATMTGNTPFGTLPSELIARAQSHVQLATWERWMFATALAAISLLPVVGMMAVKLAPSSWATATFCTGLIAVSMVVAHAAATLYLEANKFRDLPRLTLLRLEQRFGVEHGVIERLASAFPREQLEHAHDALTLELAQTRRRVGFLVGAIEQLGIVPAGTAAFFYAHKVYAERQLANSTLTTIFASVVGLYVIAAFFIVTAQRLERLSLLISHAAERSDPLKG